ncbi:DUF2254 domain-containing protein [Allohahella marinimesophila]|uniref:DUF2254 domain-containing protein n=1 Tax=Allohahella marinimesophila TaxID=1054972 RepID=A0ABP7PRE8_9GAMM
MRRLKNAIFRLVQRVFNSIAFVPTVVAVGMFLFYFLIIYLEYQPQTQSLKDNWPTLFVDDAENARTILGTLVGGIISLTVFSFSMVMVVLTRASATLSPRIIPGLITKPQHQRTLGVYIGTIIFSLVLLTNINSVDDGFKVPGLGIFFAMLFGIVSLALFVYFIHSITRSIQVDFVMDSIFERTRGEIANRLERLKDSRDDQSMPDIDDWIDIQNDHTGYFKKSNITELMKILSDNDICLVTLVHRGEFVAKGRPMVKVNSKIDDDVVKAILDCFTFYIAEIADDHYTFGFNQISEIAIKALSPGINDPGTAIRALDMLSILFADFARHPGFDVECDDDGEPRMFYTAKDFLELLYTTLGPIREYGRKDAIVVGKLVESCINVAYADLDDNQTDGLVEFVDDIVKTSDPTIESIMDRRFINRKVRLLNKALGGDREVALLSHER